MPTVCLICKDVLINDAKTTQCGHLFHGDCIVPWLASTPSCPQCRQKTTQSSLIKIYPTDSDENVINLMTQLDKATAELGNVNNLKKKLADLESQEKSSKKVIYELKKKRVELESSENALLQQVEYLKVENKEIHKLKQENSELKSQVSVLTGLQKVLNDTQEEVDEMLNNYTDLKTVATFATALKRALCDSEKKKSDLRNKLISLQKDLVLEKDSKDILQKKYAKLKQKLDSQSIAKQSEGHNSPKRRKIETQVDVHRAIEDDTDALNTKISISLDDQDIFSGSTLVSDNTGLNTSCNTSITKMVNKIQNADSPYLDIKQGWLNLDLNKFTKRGTNSQQNLIKTDVKTNGSTSRRPLINKTNSESTVKFDTFFDGLGGHSKLEISTGWKPKPIRKLGTKLKLKKS